MSGEPSQPIGRDRLDLPCIFVPESHRGPRPSHAFGRGTVEFRCIFMPDDYAGPRPGYPWIEFGRMTRDPATATGPFDEAASETSSAAAGPTMARASETPGSGKSGTHPPATDSSGPRRTPPGGGLGSYGSPDITATMALWNWLSDRRAILAALDAVSTTGPDLKRDG
jgi:hypothetical protein